MVEPSGLAVCLGAVSVSFFLAARPSSSHWFSSVSARSLMSGWVSTATPSPTTVIVPVMSGWMMQT